MVASRKAGKGYFRALVKAIRCSGYRVAVPTPLPQMQAILTRWGWTPKIERDQATDADVEVWSHE